MTVPERRPAALCARSRGASAMHAANARANPSSLAAGGYRPAWVRAAVALRKRFQYDSTNPAGVAANRKPAKNTRAALRGKGYNGTLVRIAIGADHGGFDLKQAIAAKLAAAGYEPADVGAYAFDADDDYPDFAGAVAEKVRRGEAQRGIVVCGSGVGACVAANKRKGVRACLCHDTYSARQGVEHDDMNVLCLGGRIIGTALAWEVVAAFLAARPSNEERHRRRLNKVLAAEAGDD